MAPITLADRPQAVSLHLFAKRRNWASENPGVVLVFCIVFVVSAGIISLFAYRQWMKRKAEKKRYEITD